MKPVQSSVFKDSLSTLAVRIVNAFISAALGVITARALGPEQRGIYVLPILDAALAAAFLSGLTTATSYYMLNEGRGRGVLRSAYSSAGVFVAAGMALVAAIGMAEGRVWTIAPAAVSLIPSAILAVTTGYCFGIHRVRYANYFGVLTSVFSFLLISLGLLFISRTASISIGMWIAGLFAASVCAVVFLYSHSLKLENDRISMRGYFSFAAKSGITNVLSVLNLRIDVYVLAALTSPATLGVYTVAVSGAEALKILTLVLSQTAAPRIGSAEREKAALFTAKCIRANVLIALVPSALIGGLAPWLLELLYGSRFGGGALPLRILAVGIFASAPSALLSAYYTLKLGKPMLSFWNCALSAAICCMLSVGLIPVLGMNGAALASTCGYIVSQIVFLRMFLRDTGLRAATVLLAVPEDFAMVRFATKQLIGRLHNAGPA